MTNSLETVLIDSINATKEGLGKAVDFALAQAPEVCEQYLRIELIKTLIEGFFSAALAGIILYFCLKVLRWWLALSGYERGNHIEAILMIFPLLMGIALTLCAYNSFVSALTIYLAPKVYLIEFATKLLKN